MVMELRYGITKGLISLFALGLLLLSTSTLMFFHNTTELLSNMIYSFSQGSLFFNLWSRPPFELILKVYIFNVTNSDEFLARNEKLNVTEIGPYVYREILTNVNATFNDTDGTVTYSPHREFVFDRELSVSDEKNDYIITTNIPFVGLQAMLSDKDYFASWSFAILTNGLDAKPFLNISIHDYLFGYTDSMVTYANGFLPSYIDFDKFGIFHRLISRDNGNRVTMSIDPKKTTPIHEEFLTEEEKLSQYHIVKWNGLAGLKDWDYENIERKGNLRKCDMVEGSFDATLFPRNIQQNRTIKLFRKAFCRPVPLIYQRDVIGKEGFRQYEYKLDDNMFDTSEENQCYCYKKRCKKGFQSIAPCYYDIPLTLSQPHFLNADPEMLETLYGLNPIEEMHGSHFTIQPEAGIPLGGSLRIQVNLNVKETYANAKTKPFKGLQIPLLWLEITTLDLPFGVSILLHLAINILPIAVEVIKYLLAFGGVILISGASLYALLKTQVRISGAGVVSLERYASVPLITISAEYLEKRLSIIKQS